VRTDAASRVRVTYERKAPATTMSSPGAQIYTPPQANNNPADTTRGDFDTAFASAAVKLDNSYVTPTEFHNPMEPHATLATWSGDELTIYDHVARCVSAPRERREDLRDPGYQRAGRIEVHRRWVRIQRRHEPALRPRGDGPQRLSDGRSRSC